jgi:hypothetical protein
MFFLSPFEVMVVGMNGANDRQDVRSSGIRKDNESIAMFGVGLGMSLSFRYAGVRHLPLGLCQLHISRRGMCLQKKGHGRQGCGVRACASRPGIWGTGMCLQVRERQPRI